MIDCNVFVLVLYSCRLFDLTFLSLYFFMYARVIVGEICIFLDLARVVGV